RAPAPPAPPAAGAPPPDARDAGPPGFAVPGILVAERQRQVEARRQRELPATDVQVGVADPGTRDPDQHLVARDHRRGHLVDPEGLSESVKSRCLHDVSERAARARSTKPSQPYHMGASRKPPSPNDTTRSPCTRNV